MQDSILFKILMIVKGNGNITSLIKDGYKYGQIAEFVNYIIVEKYVVRNDKQAIVLSEKGQEKLIELNKKYKRNSSNQWIAPDNKSRVGKLNENDVYLPNQNELFF